MHRLFGDAAYVVNYFKTFSSDPFWPCLWAIVFVLITHFVVARGVNKGIERVAKLLMPLLLLLLIIIVSVAWCREGNLFFAEARLLEGEYECIS